MPRPMILAGILGAAVGVPYLVDKQDTWLPRGNPSAVAPNDVAATPALPQFVPPTLPMPEGPGSHLYTSPAPLEGIPATSLAEVLRFDVSKEWVYSRWARKSTGLADPELFGIRVPLVSGTRLTDVAGSLTYYFSATGQVEKITLVGKTADTTELVNLLVRQYGFEPQVPLVPGEQLFQVKSRKRVKGELRTWPESILWSTSPHDSFSIELEMIHPESNRYVSRPLPRLDIPPDPGPSSQPSTPAGRGVFPPEKAVPATTVSQSTSVAPAPAAGDASGGGVKIPPKGSKPVLRWPN